MQVQIYARIPFLFQIKPFASYAIRAGANITMY